ncbi:oligosaccharide flippase family protein [Bradyrhizobium sp. BR 10289]|uniref:lipopolysaccharide biosynthesis protein n=1 Tax=Bradyrhizobium sp. BR 10289 TaxID=2749993 RepID=UPI001C646039|nr:oligosaccharide flippase family protein [Bradyrhizobium sp. BR 10289]MBW7970296.1 oligosaccharide flippase family protein [Bradyrhizobium sp. BR 10289]
MTEEVDQATERRVIEPDKPDESLGSTRLLYALVASFAGRTASPLVSILLMPFFLSLLGAESIGLIGLYTTVMSLLVIVDHVLGLFVTRETARRSHCRHHPEIGDILLTAQTAYLVTGVAIAMAITSAAPFIAHSWISSTNLEAPTVITCVVLAGWTMPPQLLFNLNVSFLLGLERQFEANALLAGLGIGRGVLGALAIVYMGPTPEIYFGSQLAVIAVCLVGALAIAWRRIPAGGKRPTLRFHLLTDSWRFSSLLIANALVFVIVSQADKVIVSGLLPLHTFGHYVLAGSIASLPALVVSPFMTVLLPRFARLVEARADGQISDVYHACSQFVSIAVLPAWAIVILFSDALVLLWTGNSETAAELRVVLPLLFSGATLLALNCAPNSLALAAGWSKYPWYANMVAVLGIPLALLLTPVFGAAGATAVWIGLGLANIIVTPTMLHRHLLIGEQMRWYLNDIIIPFVAGTASALVARLSLPLATTRMSQLLEFAAIGSIVLLATATATPLVRAQALNIVARLLTPKQPSM